MKNRIKNMVVTKRRLQETRSTTSSSTASYPGISGEGGPSAVVSSAPAGPSPGVVDSPVVVLPELDLPGPSGSSTGGGGTIELIEDVPLSALGNIQEKGKLVGKELKGNRVFDISTVASTLESAVVCRYCGSDSKMFESFKNKRGMVSRISFECINKRCFNVKLLSDPRSDKAKKLNKASVLAARTAGIGRRGLQTIMACMDLLPPVTARAYSEHNKTLAEEGVLAVGDECEM